MVYTLKYITSATDVYTKSGLIVSDIDLTSNDYQLISESETELELITGRKFTNGNAITEYLDGRKKDILGISGQKTTTINLSNYPIQSITEFKTLNTDMSANTTFGTLTSAQIVAGTYYTTDYWLDVMEDPINNLIIPYGKITLKVQEFPVGRDNIKVAYTYGYSTVPTAIKNLAVCFATIRAWISFLGGKYNFLESYSIPQQSVSKGALYDRGMIMINQLTEEANRLLDRIGRKPRTVFFSSGEER
jgi:hypothetical protein